MFYFVFTASAEAEKKIESELEHAQSRRAAPCADGEGLGPGEGRTQLRASQERMPAVAAAVELCCDESLGRHLVVKPMGLLACADT
jgi:hypothetical protein